jgi:hypothetical protein
MDAAKRKRLLDFHDQAKRALPTLLYDGQRWGCYESIDNNPNGVVLLFPYQDGGIYL